MTSGENPGRLHLEQLQALYDAAAACLDRIEALRTVRPNLGGLLEHGTDPGFPVRFREALKRLEAAFGVMRKCSSGGRAVLEMVGSRIPLPDWQPTRPDRRLVEEVLREFSGGTVRPRSAIDMLDWLTILVIACGREASRHGGTAESVHEAMRFIPADLQMLRGDLKAELASATTVLRGMAEGTVMTPIEKARLDERLKLYDDLMQHIAAKMAVDDVAPVGDGNGPDVMGFLGGADLANALGVHPSRRIAFEKCIERARTGKKLGDGVWRETQNWLPNTPQYLYRADAPAIQSLAKGYKRPKP